MRVVAIALVLVLWAPVASAFTVGGDAQSSEDLILKLTGDINKVDHTIEVTKDLVKRSPDAPYLADLYFRLAELYVERSRYLYARIMERKPDNESTLGGEQALEVQISKRLAIETYDKILSEFPEYDKNDQILFFKGHEYRELGEFDTMVKVYEELVSKYGKSDMAIEARLILGDNKFDADDLKGAEKYYLQIIALPESHLHDMARYKVGWIRINEEKFTEALRLFEAAVKSRPKAKKGAIGDAKSLDVKREALNAMVWPFSEVRKATQAPSYFRSLSTSKTEYLMVLKKLANRYYVKTEYSNSALLYREIVRLSSDVEENIEYVQRIYESVRNMSRRNPRRYASAATDVEAIVKTVARFQNHYKFKEEEKGEVVKNFELLARDLATRLHTEAQKKGDKPSARVAAKAYRQYLSLFQGGGEYATMQGNRASALFQADRHLDSGRQYEEIARLMEDGPERRDTIYQAILAYHKALDNDTVYRRKNPTKRGLLSKLETLRGREGLKQLGAYYVKRWPQSKNVSKVKFNIATMYYQQGDYERATDLFASWVREYPTDKNVSVAGNLALDSLNKLDDLDGLAKLATEFAENAQIRDSRFKADAARLAKATGQRKVEMTVLNTSEGDFSETMLSEWEKHKDSAQGEEFLYAGFVKFKNESNVAGVFDFGNRIIGAYPDSKRLSDVFGTMGAFAVRAADFDRAAFLFEEYKRRFPKAANANQMLMSSANFHFLLGNYDKAAETFRGLRREGDNEQRREAHSKLMTLYASSEDWGSLASVAQTASQFDRSWKSAAFYLGLAYLGEGKAGLAQRELTRAAQLGARGPGDEAVAGRAPYELARLLHQQYDGVQFRDAAGAEQVLGAKLQLLEALEGTYVTAIQAGQGEWGLGALHGVARAYGAFGDFIANAPVPGGLPPADAQQYRQALAGQGQQYAAKAQETLAACKAKALEIKVLSPFATACLTSDLSEVTPPSRRVRGRVGGDEGFQQQLGAVRAELAKKPESMPLLMKMARMAVGAGDFHLAKLVVSKALEVDPRSGAAHNLLGVTNWSLGDHAAAQASFQRGESSRHPAALANYAALLFEYGYESQARKVGSGASSASASGVDFHPSTASTLSEMGQ